MNSWVVSRLRRNDGGVPSLVGLPKAEETWRGEPPHDSADSEREGEALVVFVHVPKTAGSTVGGALKLRHGDAYAPAEITSVTRMLASGARRSSQSLDKESASSKGTCCVFLARALPC